MNHYIKHTAALSIALAFCIPSAAFSATNLVPNGDLEAGTTNAPTGWLTSYWGTITGKFTYPVAGNGSAKAARIEVTKYTSGDAKWYFKPIPVTAGTTYQISEDYRSNIATEIDVVFTVAGKESYSYLAVPATTGGNWVTYVGSIKAPAGATAMTIYHLVEKVGYLELDNVQVSTDTPTPQPQPPTTTNLISNGNLESGGTNAPTGWTADYWGTLTGKFTYPVAGNGGGKATQLQITKYTSGDAKWYFKHVLVSSQTIYKFSLDYLSTAKTNVSVEYKMSDGTFTYQWISDLPAASSWTTYTTEITVPKGAVSITVLPALVSLGTLTIDNATLVALPANPFASGMVTFVFDDGLVSQYKNALPILNAAGYKASFGIITTQPTSGNAQAMTWAQIKDLTTKGHEVSSHTRTHAALTTLTSAQLTSEVKGSYTDLVAQGITPKTFVYPLGDVNAAVEAAVKAAGYTGARGSYFGLNTVATDDYDLYDIRLDKSSTLATIQKYIDQAVEDKRWIVFELHDVLATGGDDYAVTPAFLQSVINYVKQKGAAVVTLDQGISKLNP